MLLEGVGFGEVRVSFDRSSVEAGQVFEVPPGDSADRMWPEDAAGASGQRSVPPGEGACPCRRS